MKQENNRRRLKLRKRRKYNSSKRHDEDISDDNAYQIEPLIQPTLRFFDSDDYENENVLQYDDLSIAEIAQDCLVEDDYKPCNPDNTTVREKTKSPPQKRVQINQAINKQENKKPIKKSKQQKKEEANPTKNFPSFFFRFMLKLAKKSQHANLLPKQVQLSKKKKYSIKDINGYLQIQELRDLFIESLESNHILFYILDSNKLVSIKAYIEVLSVYYQQIIQQGEIVNQTNSIG